MAQGHIDRLLALDEVQIVALADISDASFEKTVKRQPAVESALRFFDYRQLLDTVRPDAVVICTPHTLHYEQAVGALDAGAHVLLEKPMVCRVVDAKALLAKIDEAQRVVGLGYQRHAQPQYRYIHERISSGSVGAVQFVTALQQQNWLRSTIGTWRHDPALSGGGQLNDSGSHLVDVLLWTTGLAPEAVSSFNDNKCSAVDINTAISVRFVGGAMGTLNIIGDAPGFYEDVTIWCERGAFYVRAGQPLKVQATDGSFSTPDASEMPAGSDVDTNFIRAIQGKEEIAAPPICGLRTIEFTEAAWQSAAVGGAMTTVALNL